MFGNRNEVDWNSLGVSFGTGVVGVGLVSKVQKLGTIIKFGAETAIDISVSASSQYLKTGKVEGENVFVDLLGSKVGVFIANGRVSSLKASDEMKVVDTFIDRQTRKINNPKQINPSRIKARENVLNEVQSAKDSKITSTEVKASVTSSGFFTSVVNPLVDADDKKGKSDD
jgi:pSer/pThr/pTyr-binding forkhead associated (FHA) protein